MITLTYAQRTFLRQAMEEKAQTMSGPWDQSALDSFWNLVAPYWEMMLTLPGHDNEKLALRAIDLAANSKEETK